MKDSRSVVRSGLQDVEREIGFDLSNCWRTIVEVVILAGGVLEKLQTIN